MALIGFNPSAFTPVSTGNAPSVTPTSANVNSTPAVTNTDNVTGSSNVTNTDNVKDSSNVDIDALIEQRSKELAEKAITADANKGKAKLDKTYKAFVAQFEDNFKAESKKQQEKDFWRNKPDTGGLYTQNYSHSATEVGCKYNNFTIIITSTVDNVDYNIKPNPTVTSDDLAFQFEGVALRELKAEGYDIT